MTDPAIPRTEAGRAMYAKWGHPNFLQEWNAAVLAIEAEAASLPAPDGLSKVWRTIEEATGDTLSKEQLASIFDMHDGFTSLPAPDGTLRAALEQAIGLLDALDAQARDGGGSRREVRLTVEAWNDVFIPLRQKMRAALAAPDGTLRAAQFVAGYWLVEVMASDTLRSTGMSHPIAMILAALGGETDPRQLGLSDDAHDAFRAALAAPDEPRSERRKLADERGRLLAERDRLIAAGVFVADLERLVDEPRSEDGG